jgi:PD-(D/E)XK endonuclease
MLNPGLKIKHPKQRGEWAEMRFMARAAEHGLTVTKPFGDCCRYDFVVEYNGCLLRVQVKATTSKQYGSYACNLRTGRGRMYAENEIDFLAAYVIPLDVWYIFPAEVAINYRSLVILSPHLENARHARFREAWHLLKEKRCSGKARDRDVCLRHGCQSRQPQPQSELSS